MSEDTQVDEGVAQRKPGTFVDSRGVEWTPQLTSPVLIEACRKCNVRLNDLLDFSLNLGDLIDVLWYACREQAQERKMTRIDFYTVAVPTENLWPALMALGEVLRRSFPQMGDLFPGAGGGPFAPGRSQTSSNSADTQGSPPATT